MSYVQEIYVGLHGRMYREIWIYMNNMVRITKCTVLYKEEYFEKVWLSGEDG